MTADGGSKSKKWAFGCLGGCLGFALIAAVLIGFTMWYVLRGVPVVPPETFMAPGATAFLSLRAETDDEAAWHWVHDLMRHPALSEWIPKDVRRGMAEDPVAVRERLRSFAPVQIVVIVRPDREDESLAAGVALSVHRYTPLIRLAMRAEGESPAAEYRGVTIYGEPGGEGSRAARGNNLMWAGRPGLIRDWIDRLIEQAERRAAEEGRQVPEPGDQGALVSAYGRLDRSRLVRFACLNRHGELSRVLQGLPQDTPLRRLDIEPERIASVAGQLGPIGRRDARFTLWFECEDPDTALLLQEGLRRLAEAEGVRPGQLTAQRQDDRLVRVKGRIPGFVDKLARFVSALVTELEKREEEPLTLPSP